MGMPQSPCKGRKTLGNLGYGRWPAGPDGSLIESLSLHW